MKGVTLSLTSVITTAIIDAMDKEAESAANTTSEVATESITNFTKVEQQEVSSSKVKVKHQ